MFGSRTHTQSQYERVTNKTYQWRSTEKNFFYYDREKGERVALPDGAKLIPLTATNSVTGGQSVGSGASQHFCRIYSNEFVDYKSEIVRVRKHDPIDGTNEVLFEGVYSPTVRDAIANVPYCKFTKNLYCLLDGEVVKLELKASSLAPWIEFEDSLRKTHTFLNDCHCVTLSGAKDRTNGAVHYSTPEFAIGDISQEENDNADKIAAEVEEKLAHNRATFAGSSVSSVPVPGNVEDQPAPVAPAAPANDPGLDAALDTPLDEIPF